MKHLFEAWPDLQDRIQRARVVYLLFDYDGTLTPIVSRPDLALCPPEIKRELAELRMIPAWGWRSSAEDRWRTFTP